MLRNPWRAGLLIFALSLSVRIALVLLMHTNRELERTELINIAVSVAEGRGFANAHGPDSGPSAHFTPLYPLLLSGVFKVFGTGSAGAFVQQTVGYAASSAAYATLPAVAGMLELSPLTGIVAGIAAALLPLNFWAERGSYTNGWAALFVSLIVLYAGRVWRQRDFSLRSALSGGIFAGIVMLTDPVVFPFMVALAITGLIALRWSHRLYWCVLLLTPCVMLTPWTVRNALVLGSPIWMRSNLGLELSTSNTDGTTANSETNALPGGINSRRVPYSNRDELRKLTEMGEVAYNAARMQEAKQWILSHPRQFSRLTVQRFFTFWFPPMLRPIQTLAGAAITLLGLAGFVMWYRNKAPLRLVPLILLVVFPLPYYILQASSRYRFPIYPLLLLFCCAFVLNLAGVQGRNEVRP